MESVYTFLLNQYKWVIAVAMIPYIHLIRRTITLHFGTMQVIRVGGTAGIIRGKIRNEHIRNLYARDGCLAGISAVMISLASIPVPAFRSLTAAAAAMIMIIAGFVLFFISAGMTAHQIGSIRRKIRAMSAEKIMEILAGKKDQTDRH